MRRWILLSALIIPGLLTTAVPVHAKARCAKSSMATLPDVRITAVTEEAAPVPHCKVAGVIGTETNFELLLPNDWNGKFVMGGGGGFAGFVINTSSMFGSLQSGYATVGTDTGHQGHPLDASWAMNNLERIVSFGHQAVHRTAVTAKAFIADYYDRHISRSYFTGCSRGGGQALTEAQRYPEDFDGIVAGAPAYSWTVELGARNTLLNRAMYPNPDDLSVATITPAKQQPIDNWVETGEAPDQLTAFWLDDKGQPDGSRPVCAYPKYLVYKGSGNIRDSASFHCVSPE